MIDLWTQTYFQLITTIIGALGTAACAILYFRRVRMERPAIGVFNGRDIIVLFFFILTLPMLYLILPDVVLTGFLVLTFTSALYIMLSPLLQRRYVWLFIIALIVTDIVVTETLLGTQIGWQIYWVLNSMAALLAAVGVSNLYVQGGMRLKHVAIFAFILGFYDVFAAFIIPITQRLADNFEARPLDPSIGFKLGAYNANIGIGDLLVYSLFIVAAYKGFGKRGIISSFVIITIFGVAMPSFAPIVITTLVRGTIGVVVPAQMFFGPAALVTYLLLARRAPERNMAQWYKTQAESGYVSARTRTRTARVAQPVAAEISTEKSI